MSDMKITIGPERLSMTVTRKTGDDLVVSQHSSERWFRTEEDATEALRQVFEAFLEAVAGTSEIDAARTRRVGKLDGSQLTATPRDGAT